MKSPPLILIVDDNPTNLDILQARLAAHNYQILTATDGEAGLAVAREQQPDLILLDIMMPKMDGIEVCRRLRADRFSAVYAHHHGYGQSGFERCRRRS